MQRGGDTSSGGLGPQLVGERININRRITFVVSQLGEGEKTKLFGSPHSHTVIVMLIFHCIMFFQRWVFVRIPSQGYIRRRTK